MKPRVAITVGDPSGIGPEVAAKAGQQEALDFGVTLSSGVRFGILRGISAERIGHV